MKQWKKRLAICLCLLLAAPTVISALPVNKLEAEAASGTSTNVYGYYTDMQVEQGMTFNMGDLFQYSQYKNNKYIKGGYLSDLSSGVSYKSSNKNVITVSSKGDITVKKTGKAVITTKYKGIPVSTTITAVKKNGLKSNKYSSLRSKAKNVAKVYGNGITSKNRYKLAQAVMTCRNARWAVTGEYISQTGFVSYYSVQTGSAHRLVAPEMIKAAKISSKLSEYAYNNNPVGTKASKNFKITSVTAKKNSETLTIKTNQKLNDTQVFAIKYIYINDTYLQNDKKAVFNVYVKDTKTGHYYRGTAYAKQGSNQISVRMDYLKLKSNTKYQVYYMVNDKGWAQGKTFTAK